MTNPTTLSGKKAAIFVQAYNDHIAAFNGDSSKHCSARRGSVAFLGDECARVTILAAQLAGKPVNAVSISIADIDAALARLQQHDEANAAIDAKGFSF